MGSNENPLGPSPRAVLAWRRAADQLHRYPDPKATALRASIAAVRGLPADRIVCTHGAEQAIELAIRAVAGPGDEVVSPALTFKMVEVATKWAGARYVTAPLDGWSPTVESLLEAVTPRTRLVAFASPNNPTGRTLPSDDIQRLRRELPPRVLMLVDQAYAEIDTSSSHELPLELCRAGAGTIVVRTFSKGYGLAGARVGWLAAAEAVVERVRAIHCPFHLATPALEAAKAALEDDSHLTATARYCDSWRPQLRDALRDAGFEVIGAAANFVSFTCPQGPEAAARLRERLLAGGIYVRPLTMYGIPGGVRVTVGSPRENQRFLELLRDER